MGQGPKRRFPRKGFGALGGASTNDSGPVWAPFAPFGPIPCTHMAYPRAVLGSQQALRRGRTEHQVQETGYCAMAHRVSWGTVPLPALLLLQVPGPPAAGKQMVGQDALENRLTCLSEMAHHLGRCRGGGGASGRRWDIGQSSRRSEIPQATHLTYSLSPTGTGSQTRPFALTTNSVVKYDFVKCGGPSERASTACTTHLAERRPGFCLWRLLVTMFQVTPPPTSICELRRLGAGRAPRTAWLWVVRSFFGGFRSCAR